MARFLSPDEFRFRLGNIKLRGYVLLHGQNLSSTSVMVERSGFHALVLPIMSPEKRGMFFIYEPLLKVLRT